MSADGDVSRSAGKYMLSDMDTEVVDLYKCFTCHWEKDCPHRNLYVEYVSRNGCQGVVSEDTVKTTGFSR